MRRKCGAGYQPGRRRGVRLVQRREVVYVQRGRARRVGRPRAERVRAAGRALGAQAHAAQRHCARARHANTQLTSSYTTSIPSRRHERCLATRRSPCNATRNGPNGLSEEIVGVHWAIMPMHGTSTSQPDAIAIGTSVITSDFMLTWCTLYILTSYEH